MKAFANLVFLLVVFQTTSHARYLLVELPNKDHVSFSRFNEGNEVIRPALFSSIESMAGWMTVTSGVVSQIYPYQCGGDDVTRAQKRGVCGRPKIPFNLNLFDPVDASNAEDAWHQMMEEVKAYHPDFPRNHFQLTYSQGFIP